MEGIVEGDEFMLCAGGIDGLAHFAGEFYGSLIRLRAGVADKRLRSCVHSTRGGGLLNQEFGKCACPGIVVEVGSVNKGLSLESKTRLEFCIRRQDIWWW